MAPTAERAASPRRPPPWRRPRYRAIQKLQRNIWGRVFLDVGGDQRSTLYVAGGGKSGTTWIAEFLNYRNEYRYMWEPLTPPYVPRFSHFRRGQYLRPGNGDAQYREPLEALLTGRIRDRWIDHLNCVPIASRRLIKDVHANLLLKWVSVNLPGTRIVFVIRHPLAVIVSRIDTAPVVPHHEFDPDLHRFLEQDDLVADFLAPFEGAMRDASTLLEQHALWWCIENFVPLRQFNPSQIHAVCYERLRWTPEEEMPGLAAFIGRDFDQTLFTKMQRPSRTAGYGGSLTKGVDPATAWTRRCSWEDVRRVMRILSMFGLDEIYTDSPIPRARGLEALMARAAPDMEKSA